jgi:hypothetical protein
MEVRSGQQSADIVRALGLEPSRFERPILGFHHSTEVKSL